MLNQGRSLTLGILFARISSHGLTVEERNEVEKL